ncbi:tumor necrosis factor receptor superfamily member 5-like isoform X2 [Heptranchias perlo]|uniref:tumor necrosis factor receptor superfamily member 5-like isoform X2 n=1 Tax=Heptranchias perlo TaxID=212740 RepID=UPI00355A05A8
MFLAWILLLLGCVQSERACYNHEYQFEEKCCRKCEAGSFVERDCTSTTETVCTPCADGGYTDALNGLRHCLRCPICDREHHLTELEPCTPVKPTRCVCDEGFHCNGFSENGECTSCKQNVMCGVGEGATTSGSNPQVIHCEPCPDGSFSNIPSQRPCRPWTRCEELGMETVKAGSPVSDSECGESSHLTIVLVLGAAVICSLMLLLTYCCRKKHKGTQTTTVAHLL